MHGVFSGLQRLVMKNIVYGVGEIYRGVFPGAQVKILQKFIPELSSSDVIRYEHTKTHLKSHAESHLSLLFLYSRSQIVLACFGRKQTLLLLTDIKICPVYLLWT